MTGRLDDKNLREPVSKYMHKGFVSLGQNETVEQAAKSLINHDITREILYLYVTDEENRLVGVVPVRKLLTNVPQAKVSSIMVTSPVSVLASDTVLRACELFSEYRFLRCRWWTMQTGLLES